MEKQINKYLNGVANPEEFSEVLQVLCSAENEGIVTSELFKSWEKTQSSAIESRENDQLLDKIHHRIALEESEISSKKFRIYQNLLRVAAILIVGLIISTIVIYNRPQSDVYSMAIETVKTPFGARTNFKLSDGSEVWLNSGSVISFPRQFGIIRNIELSGQAYFKVSKDGKPFIVKTASGSVEVMGTSFDVKDYKDENFETTLVEGSVKVIDNKNQLLTLKPGQQAVINGEQVLSMKAVKTELITSWRDGKLIFDKEPFQNVAKKLERWYNVKIELQGERLKKLGYTGTIEQETFGEVLELINATTPIIYSFNKKERILKISGRKNTE
jgi:transmembrane sensor